MTVTAAIVLFTTTWFLVFLCVLPLRLVTQEDAGSVVPGTHRGAPHEPALCRKALVTTAVTAVLFVVMASVILWGPWGVRDLDWFGVLDRP